VPYSAVYNVMAMIIPANGILQIRPFAEHRAANGAGQRTAIVESSWLLGPLFLFNNLHALHHEAPNVPWYEYNERYRTDRERLIRQNGDWSTPATSTWRAGSCSSPHDVLEHPMGRCHTASPYQACSGALTSISR